MHRIGKTWNVHGIENTQNVHGTENTWSVCVALSDPREKLIEVGSNDGSRACSLKTTSLLKNLRKEKVEHTPGPGGETSS